MTSTVPVATLDKGPEFKKKLWGYEQIIVNDELYCGKILTVLPAGFACSIHYHVNKQETFHILRGSLCLDLWDRSPGSFVKADTLADLLKKSASIYAARDNFPTEVGLPDLRYSFAVLHPGDTLTITPCTPHRFWALKEVVEFLEVSTKDEPGDSIRIVESGPVPCSGS